MIRAAALVALAVALGACAAPSPSPSETAPPSTAPHSHDPAAESLKADLLEAFGMSFEPAGPHHEIGRAPDGVELDLVGVPVEEVVLSLPRTDLAATMAAGRAYLPHLAELLGGPSSAWDWVAEGLTCREDDAATCDERLEGADLLARFTDGGPDYIVLVVSIEP
jgi:hypothetical protein